MLQAFVPHNRRRTSLFLVAAALFALAAGTVGINDNPLGIALAMLAPGSLVLAFTHIWRTSRQFRRLTCASLACLVALLAVGVAVGVMQERVSAPRLVDTLLGIVSAASLLAAGFLCIPAFVIGVVGALVMHRRRKR